MLARVVVSASLAVFVATQAPAMLASGTQSQSEQPQPDSMAVYSGRSSNGAKLSVGLDGHFSGRFLFNGHAVDAVVDTGATFVALNESIARTIGIHPDDLVYNHTVATAAGDIKAARINIASISFGEISMSDVDVLVVQKDVLPFALIGLSFLNRLSAYSVSGSIMNLVE